MLRQLHISAPHFSLSSVFLRKRESAVSGPEMVRKILVMQDKNAYNEKCGKIRCLYLGSMDQHKNIPAFSHRDPALPDHPGAVRNATRRIWFQLQSARNFPQFLSISFHFFRSVRHLFRSLVHLFGICTGCFPVCPLTANRQARSIAASGPGPGQNERQRFIPSGPCREWTNTPPHWTKCTKLFAPRSLAGMSIAELQPFISTCNPAR